MTLEEKICEIVKELCSKANVSYLAPCFDLRGSTAGMFNYGQLGLRLRFNLDIASKNPDNFLKRTPVHEVAHYVRYYRNGMTHDLQPSGNRDIHGAKWKGVMKELGATDIKRCHSYKVSNKRLFAYQCKNGHYYELTTIRHNKQQKGTMHYCCNECNSTLILYGEI